MSTGSGISGFCCIYEGPNMLVSLIGRTQVKMTEVKTWDLYYDPFSISLSHSSPLWCPECREFSSWVSCMQICCKMQLGQKNFVFLRFSEHAFSRNAIVDWWWMVWNLANWLVKTDLEIRAPLCFLAILLVVLNFFIYVSSRRGSNEQIQNSFFAPPYFGFTLILT